MRGLWVAGAFLVAVGGLSPPAPLAAGPRLETDATVHDFGEVRVGDEVRHVFRLANLGDEPLIVSRGRASCACSAAIASQGVLPPGTSGWIEVFLDSASSPGSGARTVEFSTNDESRPRFELTLSGRVVRDVTPRPEKLFFGRVPAGVGRTRTLVLEAAPGVSIKKVRRGSRRLKMKYERLPAPRSGIALHVELKPQTALGPFEDELIITLAGGREETQVVQVLGVIEPAMPRGATD